MKLLKTLLLAGAGLLIAGQASADEALAKAKNCMSCHAMDKKVVGPSYKDVAAKYKGMVSIELEDANFNGTEAGEKLGILAGARYLEGV